MLSKPSSSAEYCPSALPQLVYFGKVEQNQVDGSEDNTDMGWIVVLMVLPFSLYHASPKALVPVPLLSWFGGWRFQETGDELVRESGNCEAYFRLVVKVHKISLERGSDLYSLSKSTHLLPSRVVASVCTTSRQRAISDNRGCTGA